MNNFLKSGSITNCIALNSTQRNTGNLKKHADHFLFNSISFDGKRPLSDLSRNRENIDRLVLRSERNRIITLLDCSPGNEHNYPISPIGEPKLEEREFYSTIALIGDQGNRFWPKLLKYW